MTSNGVQGAPIAQDVATGVPGGASAAGAKTGNAGTATAGAGSAPSAGEVAGSTSGATAGTAANASTGQGAEPGLAGSGTAGRQGTAADTHPSPSWLEAYFWPIAVLILAFMAIVLAIVFRKRSVPVTEVQGVRRPVPAGPAVAPARSATPDNPSAGQASSETGRT